MHSETQVISCNLMQSLCVPVSDLITVYAVEHLSMGRVLQTYAVKQVVL